MTYSPSPCLGVILAAAAGISVSPSLGCGGSPFSTLTSTNNESDASSEAASNDSSILQDVVFTSDSSVPGPDGGNSGGDGASYDAPVAESGLTDSTSTPDAPTGPDASPDAGPEAGGCTLTSCGADAACVGGVCMPARRVFVSSSTSTGDLGGLSGADMTCTTLATTAGLGGSWMAWLSNGDAGNSPSARFVQATVGYRLLDGTLIASSWASLVSGTLGHAINEDEHGQVITTGPTEVWTATNPLGTLDSDGCAGFTSASALLPTASVGQLTATDATWSRAFQQFCDRTNVRIYCFEQ